MKRVIKYTAIDPYYSDVIQTYIGMDSDEIDSIQEETERHMKGCHTYLGAIYKQEVILDEHDDIRLRRMKN